MNNPQRWHKRLVPPDLDRHHQSRHAPESRFVKFVTCKFLAGIKTQMGSHRVTLFRVHVMPGTRPVYAFTCTLRMYYTLFSSHIL